jgi:two-component system, cell cycle sensor histidine kinase and response regulator CckA
MLLSWLTRADLPPATLTTNRGRTMKDGNKDAKDKRSELRRRAELAAAEKLLGVSDVSALSPEQVQQMIHELQVHQIELEMQNEELRESEELYRLLFERGKDAVVVHDIESMRFVDANPATEALWGYTKSELMTMTPMDLSLEPDKTREALEQAAKPGGTQVSIRWQRKKDGSSVAVEISASLPFTWKNRNVLYSIVRDITERKKGEDALRESEALYRDLVENIEDLVCKHDLQGNLIFVNSSSANLLGYGSTDLVGTNLRSYLAPQVRDQFDAYLAAIQRDGCASGLMLIQTKTGEKRIWEYRNTLRRESVADPMVLGIARDVTDRKRAEEELRESEERYRAVVDNIEIGISLLNANMEIVEVNRVFKEYFPHVRPGCGQLCYEQYNDPPRQSPCSYCPCVLTLQDGEVHEAITETPAGSEIRYYHLVSSPIKDSDGLVQYVIELTEDITDRKHAEEALRLSEERYRRLFEDAPLMYVITRNERGVPLISDCNELFLSSVGYTREEVLEQPLADFYSPQSGSDLLDGGGYARALAGQFFIGERQLLTRDGRLIPTVLYTATEADPSGQVIGTRAMFVDITERKKAEAALLREKSFSDAIIDVLPGTFYLFDEQGKLLRWNENLEQMAQDLGQEISKMSPMDFFVGDAGSRIEEAIQRGFSDGETSVEAEVIANDGNEAPYLFTAKRVTLYDQQCLMGVGIDISDRVRAEEEKRKTQERLDLALKGADLGLWDLHVQTGQAVANQRSAEMAGYSLDEIEQNFSFWERLLHPDDRQRALEKVSNHLAGLTDNYEDEYRVRHKSGDWRWLFSRGKVTERDQDGIPLRMTGTYLDITDRKTFELQVAEANELREEIVSESPMGIAVYRADGQCISANEALGRIVGADKESLLTHNFRNLASWKDSGLLADAELVLSGGINNQREVNFTSTFGKSVWVNARMARLTSGDEPHLLVVINDITERRMAEDALKFEREQLFSLFESINEVILVIDPITYEILFANKFTENLYGKKLIGGTCYEKLSGLGTPCGHCLNERILELQGKPYQWEYRNPMLKRDFLATDRMIRWPDGRDVKFQIAIDITERKEAEQEQDLLKAQLFQAQKMESIGTLAGGIAHDFNNLLTVVLGFSELLLIGKDERDPSYADLQKINQAAKSGADLVKSILAFGRKAEINPRPLKLNYEIEQVKGLLNRTIPKMIEIKLILSDDLATVNADPVQIEQILVNLAVNASDSMPDGGKLVIETKNVTVDQEYSSLNPENAPGDYVLLSVSDTGHGMDKETLNQIFEPFFTTKEKGRGTGLGLAMVYGIVKQHGGHVACDSKPGLGTIFKIYLPVTKVEPKLSAPINEQALLAGKETVLLADDEEMVRDLGKRILERSGYTVLSAANGKEALDLYKREKGKISLVILDLIMPGMGGKECLEVLLKIEPRVKVLIASGYAAEGQTKDTIATGASGFVGKPYDMRQMLQAVREVLDSD